jgi:hypothetical protein
MWGYDTKFEWEDVWVLYPDQCPDGYTLRDVQAIRANYGLFKEDGTKNCLPVFGENFYQHDYEPFWHGRYKPSFVQD